MRKRTLRATLLAGLVLIVTVWNFLRLWTTIAWKQVILEFSHPSVQILTIVSGLVWGLVGLLNLAMLLRHHAKTRELLVASSLTYSIWYWVERTALQEPRPNWYFAASLNVCLILFILFTLKSLSRDPHD
jgi:hypothetical protein